MLRALRQYSQTYTFYTLTDDGVRLWVNGQLIIDKWIDQGPTEWSGQIALTAGQRYDIVMEFYENGGGATAKLSWSSASQPKQIIPQSRLFPPGSGSQVSFEWLVADQLGTPRIILDKTGSLASTKRHDYLPFGEELFAGMGGRTTALGYTADTVRQKFTQKERDNETGLDYFLARYFSSTQGRFTSPDRPFMDQEEGDPQSWNLYSYVRNNPLRFSDPTGQGRWEEINGELHWIGDVDGEYDKDLGATWVAVENNPIGGYWDFGGDQSPVVDLHTHIRQGLDPDKYSFEPPQGGGLRVAGRAARSSGGIVQRFLNWAFKRGASGTITAAARPVTGQIFQTHAPNLERSGRYPRRNCS